MMTRAERRFRTLTKFRKRLADRWNDPKWKMFFDKKNKELIKADTLEQAKILFEESDKKIYKWMKMLKKNNKAHHKDKCRSYGKKKENHKEKVEAKRNINDIISENN